MDIKLLINGLLIRLCEFVGFILIIKRFILMYCVVVVIIFVCMIVRVVVYIIFIVWKLIFSFKMF